MYLEIDVKGDPVFYIGERSLPGRAFLEKNVEESAVVNSRYQVCEAFGMIHVVQ